MIGKTLAHYEIVHQLGKGGMGEVYQARDTKLGRDVALKMLPEDVSRDPERLARFRREAKLLAALNHPNIGALFGLEEAENRVFLVMELVEGEDLDARLQRGAIPTAEAMALALQISEGLEAAHAKGIVHRDLKPANVMLSPTGRIKLLDFGLARAYHGDEDDGDPTLSPTITAAMTQQGTILGTAAYMSPEQARGKPVDKQSDIWAFGALFYEMLTGRRLFDGETISDSIGAILHKDPDWELLPPDTPPQVQQLLRRTLERDREQRLHDIGDARVAIVEAQRDPTGSDLGLSGASSPTSSSQPRWALTAVAALVSLALGLWLGPRILSSPEPAPYRVLDLGVEFEPGNAQDDGVQAAIAPDGHAVAYTHANWIWVQNLDEMEPRSLDGSEGASAPFWSPDASEIGWFQGGRIWKTSARGGRPISVCEVSGQIAGGMGAHWGSDGRIVFATGSSGVRAVSALGGVVREIVAPGENVNDIHEPWLLDDGGILMVLHPTDAGPSVLAFWRDGETKVLFEAERGSRIWSPAYDRRGHVLFRRTRGDATEGLWAAPFDAGSGTLRGEPYLLEADASEASIARDGTLALVANPRRSNNMLVSRIAASGTHREILVPAHQGDLQFALSPDRRRIAFTAEPADGGSGQLWVRDLTRGTEARLTSFEGAAAILPSWSIDGEEIFFGRVDFESTEVSTYRIPSDGSREATRLTGGPPLTATPSGRELLVARSQGMDTLHFGRTDSMECWIVSLDDPASGRLLLSGNSRIFGRDISPDGGYFVYQSEVGGPMEAYLTRFPEATGRWKISLGSEVQSVAFDPDGDAIYYTSEGSVYRVDFEAGPSPRLGRPESVLELPNGANGWLAVDLGGSAFVVAHPDDSDGDGHRRRGIKVVQNWTSKVSRP